jgi:hypothetical protein
MNVALEYFFLDTESSIKNEEIRPKIKDSILIIRGCNQKFPDWPPGVRTANGTALCHQVQLYRYFVSKSSGLCHHNPLCCFSTSNTKGKRVFLNDSVRKRLDIPSYTCVLMHYWKKVRKTKVYGGGGGSGF